MSLSNEQFRQLLDKSVAEGGVVRYDASAQASAAPTPKPKAQQARRQRPAKTQSTAPKPSAEADDSEPKYRDRAKERRDGVAPESKEAEKYEKFDEEQSKFLGGDEEHTHLVKGLDFALLQKIKQQTKPEAKSKSQKVAQARVKRTTDPLARSVMRVLLRDRQAIDPHVQEQFKPGRLCFDFQLDGPDLPTIVQRDALDCPDDDAVRCNIDPGLLRRIEDLMRYAAAGTDGHRRRKKAKASAKHALAAGGSGAGLTPVGVIASGTASHANMTLADDDIFPDTGTYTSAPVTAPPSSLPPGVLPQPITETTQASPTAAAGTAQPSSAATAGMEGGEEESAVFKRLMARMDDGYDVQVHGSGRAAWAHADAVEAGGGGKRKRGGHGGVDQEARAAAAKRRNKFDNDFKKINSLLEQKKDRSSLPALPQV